MNDLYWEEEYDEEPTFQKVQRKSKAAKIYKKPSIKDKRQNIKNQQRYKENEKKNLLNGKDY